MASSGTFILFALFAGASALGLRVDTQKSETASTSGSTIVQVVYSAGENPTPNPETVTGTIAVKNGATYNVKVEVLRNDLGHSHEKVESISLDGKNLGECNPDGSDYDCTFFTCSDSQKITPTSSSIAVSMVFKEHSWDCDCDVQTWECSKENTVSGRTAMRAVARFTLIEQQSECDASANAKLNDFSSKAAMQAAGWAFDWSDTALWKPLAEFPGAYRGWKHNQDPGTVSATLQGEGTLDLTFGASVSNPVVVKLDGVEKCTASGEETRKECEISYKDGDTISVTETYSVILLHSVTFSCEGSTPAPAPTAEAATPVNVALLCGSGSEACTATQSNTPYGSHSASKALDGNSATTWSGTCTHTSPDDAPSWWKVDLGQVRSIRSVKVVGTSHSELYAKLNAGFTIRVGSDNDYSKNAACATDVTGLSSYTKTVDCIADGQYVSIQISNGALALCEVEVMGVAVATTTEYIVPTLTDWTGNPGCKYGDVDAATMVLDDDADTKWNGHPCRHSTWFMAFDFGEEVTLVAVEGRYGTPTHTPDSLRISACSSGGSTSSDPAGCTLVAGTTCPIDSENTGYQSCSLGGGGAASRYFKLEWDGFGDSGTYQSIIRDFKFQVRSEASSSSSGSGACPDQTYSGSSCDDCPEGSERDLDLAPTGHSSGTTLRCVAPADAVKVEGNRMCYCHGNLPSGNCNRFSEWEKTPSTGQNAGVNFEYVVQPASCASQASAAKGDPHLMNVKGEAFDVMQTGNMMLLEIPRGSSPATLDLALHADIERLGVVTCGPTFITSASITGRWIGVPLEIRSGPIAKKGRHQPKHTFGIRFDGRDWLPHVATQRTIELSKDAKLRAPDRMFRFQVRGLEIAVSQPKRPRIFLDIQVKGLGNLETEIGGLLGIDDHSSVEELPSGCDMPASSLALGAMEEDEALQ